MSSWNIQVDLTLKAYRKIKQKEHILFEQKHLLFNLRFQNSLSLL